MNQDASTHNVFYSYCVRPDIEFENQGKNEIAYLLVRAHPITQLSWIINVLILFILLGVANIVFFQFLESFHILIVNLFITIFILSYAWLNILVYLFNVGIVTDLKVLDFDFSAVIYKEMTEARLDKIEDVTSKTSGYFASIFNFGDVFIQTAGTEANIEYLKVPQPSKVVHIINDLTGS